MAEVVIAPVGARGEYRMTVDGVDISDAVKADSLRLTFENDRPALELVLIPESARIELADPVVRVVEGLS
ncbi:hypothetical protein MED01_002396 [Micromonospora sp. MED01]|uniref:hypothetical protein n=1 Tax=Micromonospora alfalfae TaxID=2911212 RepID=UPI001EE83CA9|nr:hypothetical protein [Micromonospora alfalfae]MCG5464231.1 hypothetical protein [Micromonospora alfalfae]